MKITAFCLIILLAFSYVFAEDPEEDAPKSEWYIKGYREGYEMGVIDLSASDYDAVQYGDAEVAWNHVSIRVKREFSKLSSKIRDEALSDYKEGWLKGYVGGLSKKKSEFQEKELKTRRGNISVGTEKDELYEIFTKHHQKGYRAIGDQEWITFLDWTTKDSKDTITFYIEDEKVKGWNK